MTEPVSRSLTLDSREEAVLLFGPRDHFLKLVRDGLGVRIVARGDIVQFDGNDDRAYEIGAKLDLFDRRAHFNLAAFYTDFNNRPTAIGVSSDGTSYIGFGCTESCIQTRSRGSSMIPVSSPFNH